MIIINGSIIIIIIISDDLRLVALHGVEDALYHGGGVVHPARGVAADEA